MRNKTNIALQAIVNVPEDVKRIGGFLAEHFTMRHRYEGVCSARWEFSNDRGFPKKALAEAAEMITDKPNSCLVVKAHRAGNRKPFAYRHYMKGQWNDGRIYAH